MHCAGRWLVLLFVVLTVSVAANSVRAQPDSVRAQILKEKGISPDHTPRGALWRAAAIPGWGQVYNRQYLKLPFVYAGLAAGVYAVSRMNDQYLLYRHANLFQIGRQEASSEGGENEYQHFEEDYQEVVRRVGGELSGNQLRRTRDKLRRWRDLSIVGTGVFYALTLVDAYVSAHLLAFSVGDDLAVEVRPTGPLPDGTTSLSVDKQGRGPPGISVPPGPGVRVRVRF